MCCNRLKSSIDGLFPRGICTALGDPSHNLKPTGVQSFHEQTACVQSFHERHPRVNAAF
jgi:hypothetical protein